MTKVSIIIPIFGVEKYIERCARSLFEQTLDDVEFIFVDDQTKDNSLQVLDKVISKYPKRKSQITILHHETNMGLPQARRTGVFSATGEYVAHCDSDDWVESSMYEEMYNFAKAGNYDIVSSGYYFSNERTFVPSKIQNRSKKLLQGPIWNKMVKRSIYVDNVINYPVANKAEDGALMTQLSYYANTIGYLSKPLYHYFTNPDSMTRILSEEECLNRLDQEKQNTALRMSFLESHGDIDIYKSDIIRWKWYTRNNLLPLFGKKNYYSLWLKTYPEINKQILFNSAFSLREKIVFLLQLCRLYEYTKKIHQR